VEREKIASLATLRFVADNNHVGMMFLAFRLPRKFDEQEKRKFFVFADLAALAIQKAQVQQEQVRYEREELAWHLHDHQVTTVATISDLATQMLSHEHLSESERNMLMLMQDGCQELEKDLRYLHNTWTDTYTDDLREAVEKIIRRATDVYGLTFNVQWCGDLDVISSALVGQLRLIASESVSNIIRHAHATTVSFTCAVSDSSIAMTIEDDGRGFDKERIRPRGLEHMQQRVRRMGGHSDVQSAPGKGTYIQVEIPIRYL
jgi:signal transduction histidine kinase